MLGCPSTRFFQLSNENRPRRAMLLSRNGTKVNEKSSEQSERPMPPGYIGLSKPRRSPPLLALRLRILGCALKIDADVRLVTNYPRVMPGRDRSHIALLNLDF